MADRYYVFGGMIFGAFLIFMLFAAIWTRNEKVCERVNNVFDCEFIGITFEPAPPNS